MADFVEKISSVTPEIVFDPTPIVAGNAMSGVIVSKQTAPFTTNYAGWTYSSQVTGLPWIPAVSLPLGTRWLIRYSCSFGAGDDPSYGTPISRIRVVSDRAHYPEAIYYGWGETMGNKSYTPNAARGAHFAGWFVYTSDGTDLEFGMQATGGKTLHFDGMILIAIPISEATSDGQKLVVGEDLFFEQQVGTVNTALAWAPILSKTFTGLVGGDYLVIACGESNTLNGESSQMRLSIDGVTKKKEFRRLHADTREIYSFCNESVTNLATGDHTFLIEGGSALGPDPKYFNRFRIILLRLAVFEKVTNGAAAQEIVFSSQYPSWQTGPFLTHTPSTDEYTLVIGNSFAHRFDTEGMLMRVYDNTTATSVHEYTSMSQAVSQAPELDKWTMSSVGCELINSQRTYMQQFATQSGTNPNDAYFSDSDLIIIGLTKKTTPGTIQTMTFSDTVSMSDATGGGLTGPMIVSESISTTDSLIMTQLGGIVTVPNTHPRLYFYNNDRLTYLRGQWAANSPLAAALKARQGAAWFNWVWALKWMMTQDPADLTKALQEFDNAINWGDGTLFESYGLLYGDNCKCMCLMYDWLYDNLTPLQKQKAEDWMLQYTYDAFYGSGQYGRRTPSGNPWITWSTDGISNNYYHKYMLGAAYVALTLYHRFWPNNLPAKWAFPYGGTQDRVFEIPIKPGGTLYQDFFQWFIDRFEKAPVNTFANNDDFYGWDRLCTGGGWHEGSHYSAGPWRAISEIMNIMNRTAGVTWPFTRLPKSDLTGGVDFSTPYMSDRILYTIYQKMPGSQFIPSFGDKEGG